ncbi:hypothetical protein [Lederbergia citrea]|uniref:Uncharacterized protein n=1 Tax=Lederbergia citrea TaxID=2833581 RepID=A0A942ULD2_9BACI|nr:hypothetical protein [Lederbergia citrea]MBS4221872.1 hypothetical protein [Lederbergia citrea]
MFQTKGMDEQLKNGILNALLIEYYDGNYNSNNYYVGCANDQWLILLNKMLWV